MVFSRGYEKQQKGGQDSTAPAVSAVPVAPVAPEAPTAPAAPAAPVASAAPEAPTAPAAPAAPVASAAPAAPTAPTAPTAPAAPVAPVAPVASAAPVAVNSSPSYATELSELWIAVKDGIKAKDKASGKAIYVTKKAALKEYIIQHPDQKDKLISDAETIANADTDISANKKMIFINIIRKLVNSAATRGGSRRKRKLRRTLKKRK